MKLPININNLYPEDYINVVSENIRKGLLVFTIFTTTTCSTKNT